MPIGRLNLPDDALVGAYTQHYSASQYGGRLRPAFQGFVYQDGNGLGDVHRIVFRTIFPIINTGATTFLRGAAEGLGQGKSLGEAAKGAIGPAAQDLVGQTVSRVMQRGRGKRRRRKRKNAGAVYKRKKTSKRKKSTKSKKRHHKRRKISLAPINF